jgi:hypothetical protein
MTHWLIISVMEGEPQWNLLGVPGIENLPGVQWKLQNTGRHTKKTSGLPWLVT